MALALTRFPGQSLFFSGPDWDASLDLISIVGVEEKSAKILLDVSGKLSRWMVSDGESISIKPDTSVQFRIFSGKVRMAITAPLSVRVAREEVVEPTLSL